MEKTNEILTIAGKRVRYSKDVDTCSKCCLAQYNGVAFVCPDSPYYPCKPFNTDPGLYAYFVPAKDAEVGTTAQAQPVPADVQEAAEKAALAYDMGTEGVAYQDGYKDGMLAERERLASCPTIKGRLAVAESRAASSELYEGKKIAYNSILGFVRSLRADLAATTAENAEADFQAEYKRYMESRKDDVSGHAVTLNLIDFARNFANWAAARLLAGAIKTNIFDIEDGSDAAKLIVSIPGAKVGDEVYIIKEEGK